MITYVRDPINNALCTVTGCDRCKAVCDGSVINDTEPRQVDRSYELARELGWMERYESIPGGHSILFICPACQGVAEEPVKAGTPSPAAP